jgi:catechol 2,3-dioxygenase-like lactoylglutathione lyase family enzyme
MSKSNKARALGFNHIALEVGDVDEALTFYGRIVDFTLRGKSKDMAFIDLGDQFLALQKGQSQPSGSGRHFGLVVDDKKPHAARSARPALRFCPAPFSISTIPGATASRSWAMKAFSSPKRRTFYEAWGWRTCQRTRRPSRNSQTKACHPNKSDVYAPLEPLPLCGCRWRRVDQSNRCDRPRRQDSQVSTNLGREPPIGSLIAQADIARDSRTWDRNRFDNRPTPPVQSID